MNYQEHLKEFEKLVHEHCNIQYNSNDGSEEIYSSIASLMIAFEEYYNKFLKPNELRAVNRNEQKERSCDTCKYVLPEDRCSHPHGCDGDYELWEQL